MGSILSRCLLVGSSLAISCAGEMSESEGESHWLGACDRDTDCDRGVCLCGVCTEPCTGDTACGGDTAAGCFVAASPGLAPSCDSGNMPQDGLCLALCEEGQECPVGTVCHLGACVFDEGQPEAAIDRLDVMASSTSGAFAFDTTPSEGAPAPVDEALDFSEPVSLPPPHLSFSGPEALLGDWVEVHPDDRPCTSDGARCVRMTIEAADGELIGTMRWSQQEPMGILPSITGPWAPALDPNVGYPAEVDAEDVWKLQTLKAEVPYRFLDGNFDDGVLRFWLSAFDPFDDWCALQTAYTVEIRGNAEYRCVPPSATENDTDLKILALCTSMDDGPRCRSADGVLQPCVCDPSGPRLNDALCSSAFCECQAGGCRAGWRNASAPLRLVLGGDVLEGTFTQGGTVRPLRLRRVP